MATYHGLWDKYEDVVGAYPACPAEFMLVYAGYTDEDYSGSALVLWVENGQLFENHDSHCSCNGLENWAPEVGKVEAVMKYEGWPGLREALIAFIDGRLASTYREPLVTGPRKMRLRH